MMRKGNTAAFLSHSLHFMMENDAGVLTGVSVAAADGKSEREEALKHVKRLRRRFGIETKSLAADKGHDAGEFLLALEEEGVGPAVAVRERKINVKNEKSSARARKAIEQIAGWMKEIVGLKRVRVVGRWKIQLQAWVACAAYNLMRQRSLQVA